MNLQKKRLVPGLVAVCTAAWLIAAIRPLDQQAWILENLLLIVLVVVLFVGHRRLELSNTSYFLLATFVILHIVGAHYTYARMPLGLWAKDYFVLSRNHYDRFAPGIRRDATVALEGKVHQPAEQTRSGRSREALSFRSRRFFARP